MQDHRVRGKPGLGKGGAIFVSGNVTVTSANPTLGGNTATDAGTVGTDNGDVFMGTTSPRPPRRPARHRAAPREPRSRPQIRAR